METIRKCPVCDNPEPNVMKCLFQEKTIAYNVICQKCGYTGRSFRTWAKAVKRWNLMCEQVKNIKKE